jgi:hypothetical protein
VRTSTLDCVPRGSVALSLAVRPVSMRIMQTSRDCASRDSPDGELQQCWAFRPALYARFFEEHGSEHPAKSWPEKSHQF